MRQYKPLIRFFSSVLIIYILWSVANAFWLLPEGKVNSYLRRSEAYFSKTVLSWAGYQSSFKENTKNTASVILVDNKKVISIADSCNALVLFVIFAGFVIAYPGKWKVKMWYIPAGLITIYFINVLRISSLALIHIHYPQFLDFNHHFTFTILVYGYIFLLWVVYINRYSYKLI